MNKLGFGFMRMPLTNPNDQKSIDMNQLEKMVDAFFDDSNSFGDEAINTIVQEMENNREDTIVILAGYPDKMDTFLSRNEGLRSRVAFHLDFPDYMPDEMVKIIELMAKEKGYTFSADIKEKCFDIFVDACDNPEFGNGRFARNLLEQAMLRQSDRIVRTSGKRKITRRMLTTFKPEDFDVNVGKQYTSAKKVFGF